MTDRRDHHGPYYVEDPTNELGNQRLAEYVFLFFGSIALILFVALLVTSLLSDLFNQVLAALQQLLYGAPGQ